MPSTRQTGNTPDLFEGVSTPPSRSPSAVRKQPVEQRRLVLPDDLPGSLKYLGDDQLDALHQAMSAELRRRGKPPTEKRSDLITKKNKAASSRSKPPKVEPVQVPLGQMNLIRASFKAGIKPGVIARQLGITLSVVRRVLAMQD